MRERDIFIEALQKDAPADVETYLASACADDAELRRRVDRLLIEHRRQESFVLDSPPPGMSATVEPPSARQTLGTQIGPYKLLEQIGEGGMGSVFLAEQTRPVRRQVALKIVKAGMDTAQVAARFEAERQALALMDHPNIAKVFDAGVTDTGRPYFVMELVKGVPITRYCDDHRLTPRQRLELFVPICHAIQHAHQKGIIHRDLKPNNVLVALYDGNPVPKVIDFGVAKALGQQLTERTMFTGFGAVVGTPEYMSPEQAQLNQLDVDTRSDVYALGVLLYELLTGTTPLEHKRIKEEALLEVLRVIREEEPPRPSTRLTAAAQLPTIAAQRGVEPAKLTGIVRGELDWIVMKALEKDRARRYETANGFARDIERYLHDEPVHACPPTAAYRFRKFARRNKAPLVAIAAVALALVLGTVVSTAGFVQANRQRKLAQQNETLAQQNEARALTEAAKATAVSDFLQETLSSANPDAAKGADYTVRQLLDETSLRLRDQFKEQPEVEAAVRATIGNAYRRLDMMDMAEPHLRRALEMRRTMVPAARDGQRQVAHSLLDYGWNMYMSNRDVEAEGYLREALAIYKQNGLRDAKLIEIFATLQLCLNEQWRHADAEAVANEALALGRELFPEGHAELANILHRLADAKKVLGDLDAAEQLARQALAMHERWHGDNHPETAWALGILASICLDRGRLDEAESLYRRELSIFKAQYGDSHASVRHTAASLTGLLVKRGDQAAVEALRAESVAQIRAALDRGEDVTHLRLSLGKLLCDARQWDAALATYSEVLATNPNLAEAWAGRASCYMGKSEWDKAEGQFSQAIKLQPDQAWFWHERGWAYFLLGKYENTIADYSEHQRLVNDTHAWSRVRRGRAFQALGRIDSADADFARATELAWNNWDVLAGIGGAYADGGRWEKAAEAYRRSLELHQDNAPIWYRYASLRLELGDDDGYRAACREMLGRFSQNNDIVAIDVTIKTCSLVAGAVADFEPVVKLADRGSELFEKHPYHWFVLAKALTAYRAGRIEEAARGLERFAPTEQRGVHSDASAFAVMAMVKHQAGSPREASEALGKAKAIIATKFPDPAARRLFGDFHFQDWLHARLLTREAERVLNEPATQPGGMAR